MPKQIVISLNNDEFEHLANQGMSPEAFAHKLIRESMDRDPARGDQVVELTEGEEMVVTLPQDIPTGGTFRIVITKPSH